MRTYVIERDGRLAEQLLEADGELTFSALRKALGKRDVKINGARTGEDVPVRAGDRVEVYLPERAYVQPYEILYEDGEVLIADKHAGITTEALEKLLRAKCGARAVHRLDRNTAGVIAFAKTDAAERALTGAIKRRTVRKFYLAEVYGQFGSDAGVYEDFLVKDAEKSRVYVYSSARPGSLSVKTGWRVLERLKETTLLEVELFTGRTHQIRAHLAYRGHFVIGDGKYGDERVNRRLKAGKQRLLAWRLTFELPAGVLPAVSGKEFTSGQRAALFG